MSLPKNIGESLSYKVSTLMAFCPFEKMHSIIISNIWRGHKPYKPSGYVPENFGKFNKFFSAIGHHLGFCGAPGHPEETPQEATQVLVYLIWKAILEIIMCQIAGFWGTPPESGKRKTSTNDLNWVFLFFENLFWSTKRKKTYVRHVQFDDERMQLKT